MKKKSYEEIYEFFKSKGLELLDKEYKNAHVKMTCMDKEGYRFQTDYHNLQSGYKPSSFHMKNPFTIDNIMYFILLNRENVELIKGQKYIGNNKLLTFKCLIHNEEFPMAWNNFQGGQGCPLCANNIKLTIPILKQRIIDLGRDKEVELVSTGYVNAFGKLKFLCLIHNKEFKMNWASFQNGQGCPICGGSQKLDIETIKQRINDLGKDKEVVLLSTEYINSNEKLIFKCLIHSEEYEQTYSDFQNGNGCYICSINSRSGENHPNWNINKTQEEREFQRKYPEYTQFIKDTLRLADYTCDITGQRGGNLVVHHLNGYHWFVKGRTDINNAVVLSEEIHKEFHSIYGCKNNTKEQYYEFKINKRILTNKMY